LSGHQPLSLFYVSHKVPLTENRPCEG
jgi:hypothetical protein